MAKRKSNRKGINKRSTRKSNRNPASVTSLTQYPLFPRTNQYQSTVVRLHVLIDKINDGLTVTPTNSTAAGYIFMKSSDNSTHKVTMTLKTMFLLGMNTLHHNDYTASDGTNNITSYTSFKIPWVSFLFGGTGDSFEPEYVTLGTRADTHLPGATVRGTRVSNKVTKVLVTRGFNQWNTIESCEKQGIMLFLGWNTQTNTIVDEMKRKSELCGYLEFKINTYYVPIDPIQATTMINMKESKVEGMDYLAGLFSHTTVKPSSSRKGK